jgi:hypothetical protein
VPEFLVELYVPQSDLAGMELGAARTRHAAAELTLEGTPVRFVRSIFVPDDETCFFLCEAASIEAVCETARRADLRCARVAETAASTTIQEVDPCS